MSRIQLQYLFQDRNCGPDVKGAGCDCLALEVEGCRLYGTALIPDGEYSAPRPCVAMFHGFPGFTRYDDLAQALCRVGCVMLMLHHRGAVRYTPGQRKGLGLAMGEPVYVCKKNMAANTVTVGPEKALYSRVAYAGEMNWISIPTLEKPLRLKARTRYRQEEKRAFVYPEADGRVRVEFEEAQRAVTVGQALVLYDGDTVVGGGTICAVESEIN